MSRLSPEDLAAFGRSMRELRVRENLTQAALAQIMGITNGQVSTVERGLSSPSLCALVRLRRALNVSIDDMIPALAPVRGAEGTPVDEERP